jgi:uroporphyrinogen decarboxylase
MTKRENVLRALRRENPESVPFDFTPCPSIVEELRKRLGTYDYQEHLGLPVRNIELNPTKKKTDFLKYYSKLPDNVGPLSWAPEWGIMGVNGTVAHFQEMLHPMANFETIQEIEEYPFPDFTEDYRWEGVADKVKELVENGLIAVANMQMTIFETSWYLRGMDNFMVDLMADPDFAEALMDKITEIRIKMAVRYAKVGFDILQLGDDVATQLDMMISPELWRSLIKPRLAKVVKAAKDVKKDILVFYHGDGNMQKIIPDIVEIGIDILNPIQPECMDPVEIKRQYGDRLSFWGTLGTQTTLPFGTPAEVNETCKKLIEEVGKGGGLLLAPTHMVEPEVPIENLMTFIETVKGYGKY